MEERKQTDRKKNQKELGITSRKEDFSLAKITPDSFFDANARSKVNDIIRKVEEKVEEKNQTPHIIYLIDELTSQEDLKQIAEEKSQLIVVSQEKNQIKTLCFRPKLDNIIRMQDFETFKFESDPIKEDDDDDDSMDLKKFDRELRTRFEDTSSFPYSVHGIVRIDLGKGSYRTATGILIGADLVLTAAHNIYDYRATKQKYSGIEFIPGINEQEMPFGKFKVIESYVPDEFLKTWEKEDYALLVLDGIPGAFAGYFGLHVAEKQLLKGKELNIIGYPGSVRTKDKKNKLKILSGEGRHQLWGMKGKKWSFADGKNEEVLINYEDILTTPGQSGSGVFYQVGDTDEYYVIGIHALGSAGEGTYNSATWITKERFNQIEKWVKQSRRRLVSSKIADKS